MFFYMDNITYGKTKGNSHTICTSLEFSNKKAFYSIVQQMWHSIKNFIPNIMKIMFPFYVTVKIQKGLRF